MYYYSWCWLGQCFLPRTTRRVLNILRWVLHNGLRRILFTSPFHGHGRADCRCLRSSIWETVPDPGSIPDFNFPTASPVFSGGYVSKWPFDVGWKINERARCSPVRMATPMGFFGPMGSMSRPRARTENDTQSLPAKRRNNTRYGNEAFHGRAHGLLCVRFDVFVQRHTRRTRWHRRIVRQTAAWEITVNCRVRPFVAQHTASHEKQHPCNKWCGAAVLKLLRSPG